MGSLARDRCTATFKIDGKKSPSMNNMTQTRQCKTWQQMRPESSNPDVAAFLS
jgi:hypothetical protein